MQEDEEKNNVKSVIIQGENILDGSAHPTGTQTIEENTQNIEKFNIEEIKNTDEWRNFERLRENLARKEAMHIDSDLIVS